MELIKTVVIIINSFMLIFYMVYINSKAPYKKAIGNLFYYLKTCSEKDFEKFIEYGVDTVMAPFGSAPVVLRAVKETEQKVGKKIILVDTPGINIEDSAKGRQEAMAKIRE